MSEQFSEFEQARRRNEEQSRKNDLRAEIKALGMMAWQTHKGESGRQDRIDYVRHDLEQVAIWIFLIDHKPKLEDELIFLILKENAPKEDGKLIEVKRHKRSFPLASASKETPEERAAKALLDQRNRQRAADERARREGHLFLIKIDGKALGECTVAETKAWVDQERAKGKVIAVQTAFALRLCAQLPGNEVLGRHYTKRKEIDKLYQEVEAEYASL
jgi:hypothetical protein